MKLLSLYITINTVCPILKYGSTIWDPPSASLSSSIESHSVQYFAFEMASKILAVCPPMLISFLPSSYIYTYRAAQCRLCHNFSLSSRYPAAHVVSVITSPLIIIIMDFSTQFSLQFCSLTLVLVIFCSFLLHLCTHFFPRTPLQIQLYKCSQSISYSLFSSF